MNYKQFNGKHVLILEGYTKQSLPFIRGFKELGCEVSILCGSKLDCGYASRLPDHKILGVCDLHKPKESEQYIVELIKNGKYDLVFPAFEFSARILAHHKEELSKYAIIYVNEQAIFDRANDKNEVMRLATEGQTIEKPSDIIKSPLTLEFLGLKPDVSYSESKLENAIISKMQQFLLELGKGFLFEARQKRFTFDEQHFYVDLVFYNRLLQCYVLIDLKTDKLSHQDLGQMQMYVNYYDRFVKQDFEKPTIGILLCERKNDALVELTLPKDANIYASAYQLYLPDKALLQAKVKEWIAEFKEGQVNKE